MEEHIYALPKAYKLGEYRIERVLGSGGFGITYLAIDENLNMAVAIKEYLPNEFASRVGATVVPNSTSTKHDYEWGLTRFLDEARALARFDHPNINRVRRFFKANDTAYLVLEYIEGETLMERLRRDGTLPAPQLERMLKEILSGLELVHRAGFVHRDIKPGNIMLRRDCSAVLLDFGAAREAVGQRSKSITSILTPGYAPLEQYDQTAKDIGPWTDIYALGMVAYKAVSGCADNELIDAVARARLIRKGFANEDMPAAAEIAAGRYKQNFLSSIDAAIRVDEEDRPQSVVAWRQMLFAANRPGSDAVTRRHPQTQHFIKPIVENDVADTPAVKVADSVAAPKRGGRLFLAIIVAMFAGFAFVVFLQMKQGQSGEQSSEIKISGPVETSTSLPGSWLAADREEINAAPEPVDEFPLTINISPSDADVDITNLVPNKDYYPGIKLPSGNYHMLASRDGYFDYEFWVSISYYPVEKKISLVKKPVQRLADDNAIAAISSTNSQDVINSPVGSVVKLNQDFGYAVVEFYSQNVSSVSEYFIEINDGEKLYISLGKQLSNNQYSVTIEKGFSLVNNGDRVYEK